MNVIHECVVTCFFVRMLQNFSTLGSGYRYPPCNLFSVITRVFSASELLFLSSFIVRLDYPEGFFFFFAVQKFVRMANLIYACRGNKDTSCLAPTASTLQSPWKPRTHLSAGGLIVKQSGAFIVAWSWAFQSSCMCESTLGGVEH